MKNFPILMMLGAAGIFSIGASAYDFSGGKGTKDDPFIIKTAEDLDHVRDFPSNSEISFKQVNDIDLSSFKNWNPILPGVDAAFEGTYDGGNYTVTGLNITGGADGLGLFGRVLGTGVIKNVVIKGAYIEGGNWCGILCSTNGNNDAAGGQLINCHVYNSELYGASDCGGIVGICSGDVTDCSVVGATLEVTGGSLGGIVGCLEIKNNPKRTIADCYFQGNLQGNNALVGGVVAYVSDDRIAYIKNCASYGNIEAAGLKSAAGIVVYNRGAMDGTITNCFSEANVKGYQAGGIGGSPIDARISMAYATGNIEANAVTPESGNANWTGGIVGTCYSSIDDCYYAGQVSGGNGNLTETRLGAIAGRSWDATVVNNAYYDKDLNSVAMGEGDYKENHHLDNAKLTADEMKWLKNMKFSDQSKWKDGAGKTTPYFANQTDPVVVTLMTTTGAAGTYTGDLQELLFFDDYEALQTTSVNIADGKWSVKWDLNASDVQEKNVYRVVGKAKDLMPSLSVSATVVASAGVEAVAEDSSIKVAVMDGTVRISSEKAEPMSYQFFNLAGSLVKAGMISGNAEVSTSELATGAYILVVDNSKFKILVK